jgi:anti-sigma regulatory factor (Ser/Thr protein kinase)
MNSRQHHTLPRDLEFATQAELAKRMGVPPHLWLRAAVKELVDNALDAAEEADRYPEIEVTADPESGIIIVTDNGLGLAPDVVASIATWDHRTSSREAYAAPDRGALGNALLGWRGGQALVPAALP